ncbi:uncharacterized protein DEA37_0002591 [Paragonimus westermani]|uniref:PEHE domain-containing protein n=1 Tax=Paragonimus westermani TaxID=34504 RepID=A0A5J4NWE0_9TREM|nr:uncharacterized protein DEA37_0002591 [Paragonimus westermani]
MATAVQTNMVGILRRFHLHPMDAALNELNTSSSLAHLRKFNPHPFLFRSPAKQEPAERIIRPQSKTCPTIDAARAFNTDPKMLKQKRRLTRLAQRHSHQSVPTVNIKGERHERTPDPFHSQTYADTFDGISVMAQSPSEWSAPPTLYPPASSPGKRSFNQTTSSWMDRAPTLSNPRSPVLTHGLTDWDGVPQIEPILVTAASLFESKTPISKANVMGTVALGHSVAGDRKRTFSGASHGENLSDATESTTSMPNVTVATRPSEAARKPTTMQPSNLSHCQLRPRPPNPAVELVDSKSILRSKRRAVQSDLTPEVSGGSRKPLKRRRSFERLTEPSIHGQPDPSIKSTLRDRRSPTLVQVSPSSLPSDTSVLQETNFLTTYSAYYLPDFGSPQSSNSREYKCDASTSSDGEDVNHMNSRDLLIEVPSWCLCPLNTVIRSLESATPPVVNKVPSALATTSNLGPEPDSDTVVRTLRAGVIRTPGVLERPGGLKHEVLSCRPSSSSSRPTSSADSVQHSSCRSISEVEDTSDAAYNTRHARLETEEIRRERRSRQRTFEQELKHRLEQRDRASWVSELLITNVFTCVGMGRLNHVNTRGGRRLPFDCNKRKSNRFLAFIPMEYYKSIHYPVNKVFRDELLDVGILLSIRPTDPCVQVAPGNCFRCMCASLPWPILRPPRLKIAWQHYAPYVSLHLLPIRIRWNPHCTVRFPFKFDATFVLILKPDLVLSPSVTVLLYFSTLSGLLFPHCVP